MRILKKIFDQNNQWAQDMTRSDPDFFHKLSGQQNPQYLWIGCADSRVPANQITGMLPGQVFVHRNIANIVSHTDLNCLSVIQYGVEVLKIKHIIVCGHYGCGGIKAAWEDKENGLIDNWLRNIQDVQRFHQPELDCLQSENEKLDRLCELNVIEQVVNVCRTTIVRGAWQLNRELAIHGWIYNVKDGLLKDLDICITNQGDIPDTLLPRMSCS
ncbi:carbonate dehydratase [Desulfopila sp. IMCC35006]|uniref:carbonate dehydratase n=1 Tax=Desulfopila sp. IMCC35006 TaxID=2569542 RepID=UPI0010ACA0A1|nr:carbonate dehydratase [Desulfopila sp. IMCC35006]TKB24388.1 carbonate dehydratase [Desulfopila sp. IMCC35006]